MITYLRTPPWWHVARDTGRVHREIRPASIAPPAANYAHAVLTEGASRWLHTPGVVPTRPDGTVPDDLGEQAETCGQHRCDARRRGHAARRRGVGHHVRRGGGGAGAGDGRPRPVPRRPPGGVDAGHRPRWPGPSGGWRSPSSPQRDDRLPRRRRGYAASRNPPWIARAVSRADRRCGVDRLAMRHGATRQPTKHAPRNNVATITNDVAVPSVEHVRRTSMPTSTVAGQTARPVRRLAGRRQARAASHATASPIRNGSAGLDDAAERRPLVVVAPADGDEHDDRQRVERCGDEHGAAIVGGHPHSVPGTSCPSHPVAVDGTMPPWLATGSSPARRCSTGPWRAAGTPSTRCASR